MLPSEFLSRMQRLLGDEFDAFMASYEKPRNTGLRINPLKGPAPSFSFCEEPIPWEPDGFYLQADSRPGLNPCHDAGTYYLQEPSAMAPARLLAPLPGERVLDLCAAPGGKSTQLAAAMQGQGLLICNEINPKRARILSSNIERLGIANALVLNEHPAKLAARFPSYFDRILVDAPCSGEGMFRKEDAAVTDWSPETVFMCAARQKEILSSAAGMLKPGGCLVYSTCTFSPEENEGVISAFIASHPEFSIEKPDAPWFAPGRPDWVDSPAANLEYTCRLFPHRLRGEGHFAAVLRKESAGSTEEGLPEQKCLPMPKEVSSFLCDNHIALSGSVLAFGENYFLPPAELPELKGLKVLRAGLELGEVRKGRFIPAHALSHWLKEFPAMADYSSGSAEIAAYLRGETLPVDQNGWVLIRVDGQSLGWARGSGGILKNHYPKGLRRVSNPL